MSRKGTFWGHGNSLEGERYRMLFCEFLNKLRSHFPCSNQGQFVLEIFSALCGEIDPSTANQESSNRTKEFRYSPLLPSGLTAEDNSHRKRLFGRSKKYTGLSAPIKAHILANQNKETFVAYCDSAIAVDAFQELCAAFEIPGMADRKLVFEGLYDQFIEFARSRDDDVSFVVPSRITKLLENQSKDSLRDMTEALSPLHPGDDMVLVSEQPAQAHVVGFYETFRHEWSIRNAGTVVWEGRYLECTNPSKTRLKAIDTTIDIPRAAPGEEVCLIVQIDARGFEGNFKSIWEMKDKDGHLCFLDRNKALEVAVEVVNMHRAISEV